jgi:hypothetical protein
LFEQTKVGQSRVLMLQHHLGLVYGFVPGLRVLLLRSLWTPQRIPSIDRDHQTIISLWQHVKKDEKSNRHVASRGIKMRQA